MVEGARIPLLNHVSTAMESKDVTAAEMDEVVLLISAYSGFELGAKTSQVAGEALARIDRGGAWYEALRG